ncbi:MAG: signal peptidase II [Alphaproteobacteria bacterium]
MQKLDAKSGRIVMTGGLIAAAVIVADQYTKWFVLEKVLRKGDGAPGFLSWFTTPVPLSWFMEQQDSYTTDTLTSFLNLVMVWNRGISFGILDANNPQPPILFIGVSLVISTVLLVWMICMRRPIITAAASMIIGGAIANSIDRFRFGAVADFIDFHVGDRHWPAFNAADSCIVLGAALMIADSLLTKGDKVPTQAEQV